MIEKVKKAEIGFLKSDLDIIIHQIQLASCLMVIKQENNANSNLSNEGLIDKIDHTIKNLEQYVTKKPLFGDILSSTITDLKAYENKDVLTLSKEIDELMDDKVNKIKDIKQNNDDIKNYIPWKSLNLSLNELNNTQSTIFSIGFIETKFLNDFSNLMENKSCIYQILDNSKNLTAIYFIAYKEDYDDVYNTVKQYGFNPVILPKYDGLMCDYIDFLNENIINIQLDIKNLDNEISNKTSSLPELKKYVDYLLSEKEVLKADYLQTEELYVINGYVPINEIDNLKKCLNDSNVPYDLELTDPSDDEIVPTYTINDKFVKPFESITNMFSVPSSKEIDPNPVMSIWYWILFGMMVGDVGYGAVMLLGGFLFIKLSHPTGGTLNIAKVITYSAIPSILWGIFYNSYFGFSLSFYNAVISPMTDALPMLILSVAVGLLHIITGLIIRAIRHIKAKEIQEMLGKDASWILILIGLAGVGAGLVGDSFKAFSTIGLVLCITGVALILVFAGHEKKNIIARGLAGILGLYDATSFLGDLLSYSRIMALLMSSASVAYVMNILGGMVASTGAIGSILSIFIYIAGHAFNLVLGLLSAYVHDCRLQYIEFYGKFYDGGGIEFKPLSIKTKYIKEIKK